LKKRSGFDRKKCLYRDWTEPAHHREKNCGERNYSEFRYHTKFFDTAFGLKESTSNNTGSAILLGVVALFDKSQLNVAVRIHTALGIDPRFPQNASGENEYQNQSSPSQFHSL
jgi:hypothetical protein